MSTTRVFTDPRSQHFKSDGVTVNSSGKIYFREPGSGSTTLKSVYADKDFATAYTNPVVLDSNGRAPTIFLNGDYNIQMTDSSDVQIWRVDNYQPASVEGQFSNWDSTLTYGVNDYVRYTNGLYYISLQSGNTGNVPSSSPTYWSQAFFLTVYNSSTTYAADEVVYYDGNIYTSLQGSNTGNTPDTSYTYWKRPGVSVPTVTDYQGYVITYLPTSSPASLALTSLIPNGASESIGPTGSGATNIWTALDDLPSNTFGLKLKVTINGSRTSSTSSLFGVSCSFNTTGGANLYSPTSAGGYGSSTEPGFSEGIGIFDIILDANKRFDASWGYTGTDTQLFAIQLIGFLVEEL